MEMIEIEKIIALSRKNQQRAWEIIKDTRIVEIWESIGATVNLVGSLKLELMAKHCDIDFHVYTNPFKLADSFAAMAKLAEHPAVKRIEYINYLDAEDECIEWHAWLEDADDALWHIDIIHIIRGSHYDGYFEKVADRIAAVLTEDMRNTILQLKYETPDSEKAMGIEYYRAVIEGGVKTFDEFTCWRKENPVIGILEWIP